MDWEYFADLYRSRATDFCEGNIVYVESGTILSARVDGQRLHVRQVGNAHAIAIVLHASGTLDRCGGREDIISIFVCGGVYQVSANCVWRVV